MPHQRAGPSTHALRNSVLVFLILCWRGQSRLTGPSQPIVATVGNDIMLPCHLVPAENVAAKTLEWTRPDLTPRFVFLWRAGKDFVSSKNPSYSGRTLLFTDELRHGNMSLRLSKVSPADQGRYRCYIPEKKEETFVQLVVASDAVSVPVLSLAGIDRNKGGVVLECKSNGWHPEPDVLWLDAGGTLLPAGPTETVRGPDALYTVSSRLTVESSSSFTCRVQQKDVSQSREAQIHVPDDFFEVPSHSTFTTVGLAVSLAACIILLIVAVVLSVHIRRLNMSRTKRSPEHPPGGRPETAQLMTTEMEGSKKGKQKKKTKKELKEQLAVVEQYRRDETKRAEEETQALKMELDKERMEFDKEKKKAQGQLQTKDAEISQLQGQLKTNQEAAEKERKEFDKEQKKAQGQLQTKDAEISRLQGQLQVSERKVEETKGQLKTKDAEVAQLNDKLRDNQREADGTVQQIKGELEEAQHQLKTKDTEISRLQGQLQNPDPNAGSSAGQTSPTGPIVVDVDQHGKYIQLRNVSSQDMSLGGWKLKLQISNRAPIMHTFEKPFSVQTGKTVKLWRSGCGGHYPPSDVIWWDLKPWTSEDQLQITVIDYTGEIPLHVPH